MNEKGEFYTVADIPGRPPIANIFSEKDSVKHQRLVRPVLKLYSANKVDQFEPLLSSAIESFINVVHGKILKNPSKSWRCDQERWIEYFTWDAMSTMTFSQPLGFLTQQNDVGNLLSISQMSVTYMSIIGCMPFLDYFLDKNPIHRIGPPAFSHAAAFSFEQIAKRSHSTKTPASEDDDKQKDFLDHFLALRHNPDYQVNDTMLLIYMFANVVAGSDTVACALNSILRHTLLSPTAYRKLQGELLALPTEAIAYKELKKLFYLSAVIREGMRLCPSIGMHLERVVPPEGLHLPDGRFIPGGTSVGMNAGVLHRQSVFGENVDAFMPERWLPGKDEGEEEAKERIKAMKAADFVFGYGKRGCLGKELALMEIHVFVARLVREFEVSGPSFFTVTCAWGLHKSLYLSTNANLDGDREPRTSLEGSQSLLCVSQRHGDYLQTEDCLGKR